MYANASMITQQLSPAVSLSAISILNIFGILYLQEMMATNGSTLTLFQNSTCNQLHRC